MRGLRAAYQLHARQPPGLPAKQASRRFILGRKPSEHLIAASCPLRIAEISRVASFTIFRTQWIKAYKMRSRPMAPKDILCTGEPAT
jgi:hypothetical protein